MLVAQKNECLILNREDAVRQTKAEAKANRNRARRGRKRRG